MDSPSFCTQATGSPPAAQLPCSPAGPPSPGTPHTQGWSSNLAACFTPRSQPPTKWYVLISKPSHTCPESPEQGSAVPVVRPLHEGSRWAPDSGRACAPAPNPAASQPHSLRPGPNTSELHLTVWKSNNSPSHFKNIMYHKGQLRNSVSYCLECTGPGPHRMRAAAILPCSWSIIASDSV